MQFESALNWIWLVLGVIALAGTICAHLLSRSLSGRGSAWLRVCGVALIVTALFPYISATDDVLRIRHLNAGHDTSHDSKKRTSDELIRLYEVMDTALTSTVKRVCVTLAFVNFVPAPVVRTISRALPFASGRSPPFSAVLNS